MLTSLEELEFGAIKYFVLNAELGLDARSTLVKVFCLSFDLILTTHLQQHCRRSLTISPKSKSIMASTAGKVRSLVYIPSKTPHEDITAQSS